MIFVMGIFCSGVSHLLAHESVTTTALTETIKKLLKDCVVDRG
jgi:hypothetical protein